MAGSARSARQREPDHDDREGQGRERPTPFIRRNRARDRDRHDKRVKGHSYPQAWYEDAVGTLLAEIARQPLQEPRLEPAEAVAYLRSLPSLWADTGPEGRQALATALFAKLEVEGYRRVTYELTSEAVELGLDAALPAVLETGGQIGEFGRGERSRAYTFQISMIIVDGDGGSILSRSTDVA